MYNEEFIKKHSREFAKQGSREVMKHSIPRKDVYIHVPFLWCECVPTIDEKQPTIIVHNKYSESDTKIGFGKL